ncbi:MAG: STAS/SEC14 domain-containing protein [Chitinophagaceae bacterium]
MIEVLNGIPDHVAGFKATGKITKEDYTNIVIPEIESILKQHGHIHFLLVLNTDVGNFTAGAWMNDALIGLKHLSKWKKMAIVSDQKGVEKVTDIISPIMPGESRGFTLAELEEAKNWVSSEN